MSAARNLVLMFSSWTHARHPLPGQPFSLLLLLLLRLPLRRRRRGRASLSFPPCHPTCPPNIPFLAPSSSTTRFPLPVASAAAGAPQYVGCGAGRSGCATATELVDRGELATGPAAAGAHPERAQLCRTSCMSCRTQGGPRQ
ncbi:hypothetical protein Vafri_1470 [Volvox africanus]|nr:hypothetical protein Vafri_1470 [Volvox africanus]